MLQTAKVIAAGAHSVQFMTVSSGQITDLARAIKYFRVSTVSDSSRENPLFTDRSFIFSFRRSFHAEQRPIERANEIHINGDWILFVSPNKSI